MEHDETYFFRPDLDPNWNSDNIPEDVFNINLANSQYTKQAKS